MEVFLAQLPILQKLVLHFDKLNVQVFFNCRVLFSNKVILPFT